jgi:transcriptional regulator with XRE-family HTH domain
LLPINGFEGHTMNKIGIRLRQRRLQLGLMQRDIAAMADVSKAAVSKWESSGGTAMSAVAGLRIAKGLDVSPAWLILGDDGSADVNPSSALPESIKELVEAINVMSDQIRHKMTQLTKLLAS